MFRHATALCVFVVGSFAAAIGIRHFVLDEDWDRLVEGQELMASAKYDEAARVLRKVEADPAKSGTALEARLLLARALIKAGKPKEGAETARRLIDQLPADHRGRGRANWLISEAMEALGQSDDAARIFAAQAAKVLGKGHRARVAGYYLALAHELEKPEKTKDPLKPGRAADPRGAAEMYGRALTELTGGKVLASVTLPRCRNLVAAARVAPAKGRGGRRPASPFVTAAAELARLLKVKDLTTNERAESHLLRAEALSGLSRHAETLTELEKLLAMDDVAETKREPRALELKGETLLAMAGPKRLREAVKAWNRFLERHPTHADAAKVERRIAKAWFDAGENEEAIKALGVVVASDKADVSVRAAAAYEIGACERRLGRFDRAREALKRYLAAFPDDFRVPAAQKAIPELLLEKAQTLRDRKDLDGAVTALERYVSENPLSAKAASVAVEIGLVRRQQKKIGDAAAAFLAARDRYRSHDRNQAARAGLLLGAVEEEDRKDLEAAAKAYRAVVKSFGGTSGARQAAARLARMESIELGLSVPRLFAPGEAAKIKLSVRNVKEATFRLYRLDARDYFERRGTLDGAADTEVALVKSDRTFTYAVPDWRRYRKDTLDVAVELEEKKTLPEGAWLVAVEAEERRSVVLVLVSSIRLVVKQAPRQVFCWATDARTGEPAEGVEILLKGGDTKKPLKTDKDGVAHADVDVGGGLQVLGLRGDGVAPGLAAAPKSVSKKGLAPRAAFTLDRPVYRPGTTIRFRAVLRRPHQGSWVTPDKEKIPARLVDPRGRILAETELVTGAFGVVHGSFRTPPEAVGDYRIELRFAKQAFHQTVAVRAYKKPEYQVSVNPKSRVVRPGEEVDCEVDVRYFFGGPVREGSFEWRVFQRSLQIDRDRYQDYAWYLKATEAKRADRPGAGWSYVANGAGSLDAEGKGRLTFRTPLGGGDRRYLVQVMVRDTAGAPVSGTGMVYAAAQDRFAVVLSSQRTFRAGDTASVRVITADPGYAPVASQGRLRALIERKSGAETSFETISDTTVDTGLAGEATVRVKLPRAGDWVLRFECEDARGAPVTASTRIVVSGERPDLAKEAQLRFERSVYRAGETARAHLSVPAAGRPVLLTFEGERVLEWRLLRPKQKSAVQELLMTDGFAPNVTAAIALPHEGKLLTSQDRVVVLRYLQVSVEPEKATARPKEKVKLRVRTRDQLGRPVAGAVAVRVSDGALGGLGGTPDQDPRFVFNKDVRAHLVATGSSFAFRFTGSTRFLDPDLLNLQNEKKLVDQLKSLKEADGVFAMGELFDEEAEEMAPAQDPQAPPATATAKPGASSGRGRRGFGGRAGGRTVRRAPRGGGAPGGGGGAGVTGGVADGPASRPDARQSAERQQQGQFRKSEALSERLSKNNEARYKQADKKAILGFKGKWAEGKDRFDGPFGSTRGIDLDLASLIAPELRERFLEVAGWWPDLVTDARGEASVDLELPDNLTRWDLLASGAAAGASVGQGTSSLTTSQSILVRVERPRFLTSEDEAMISTVLHSNLDEKLAFHLALRSAEPSVLEALGMTEASFELDRYGVERRDWTLKAKGAGAAMLEATARSTRASDAVKRGLPVVAFGEPWTHASTEKLVDRTMFRVDVPHEAVAGSTTCTVIVEAGMEAEVLSGLRYLVGYPYGCLEQSLNRFVPAMLLAKALERAGRPQVIDRDRLDDMVRRGLDRIATFQTNDGGFSYWPRGATDPWVTAMCLETLIRARDLGYKVPTGLLDSARRGARALARKGGHSVDARAALVHALVRGGDPNPDVVNALFRDRSSLSVQGLSRLLLACHRAGRPGMVQTLFRDLTERRAKPSAKKRYPYRGRPSVPWLRSDLEASALALLAYEVAGGGAADTNALVEAVRRGVRGRSGGTKAVALGIEALTAYVAREGGIRSQGAVRVLVDGKEVAKGDVGGDAPVLILDVPASAVPKGKHEIVVEKSGGAAANCRVVVRNVKPAKTVAPDGNVLTVARRLIPYRDPDAKAPRYEPGHDIVRPEHRPRPVPVPDLAQAVEGRKVTVELRVTARENLEHLVIEDPQLAGLEVIESGVRGPHDRFERRDARLLFFKNRVRKGQTLVFSYPCYAVHQGRFAGLPARAEEMYAPERWGRSGSSSLQIVGDPALLANVAPREETPDETWRRAGAAYAKQDFAKVVELLAPLPGRWQLVDNVHDDLLRRLLVSYLRLERWPQAVKAREELRLRNPDKEDLSVEDRERLGRAYLGVGDAWSARGHFQSVVLTAFAGEMKVCDAYRGLRRGSDAIRHLMATLVRYPPVADVAARHADVASWLMKEQDPSLDPKQVALLPPIRRVRWRDALTAHLSVMAWHQGTALAEEAGFQRITLLRGLGDQDAIIAECRRYLERHPRSGRTDAATFHLAQALFAKGNYDEAVKYAKMVWEKEWVRMSGSRERRYQSNHRWQAGYLIGRVAHVGGRYDDAVTWYGRVRKRVPDAQQSWLFFTQKELSVGSLVRIGTGDDVAVPYTAKNLEEVRALVYPVDLSVLFAVKKSFDKLNSAELAGIRPAQEATSKTGLERYKRGSASTSLGKKEPGAYLVVLRSGSHTATTLVLVTSARLTVQRSGGAVRVYLVDGDGKPLPEASVKLGVGGRIFHSGRTDERGMLDVADPGRGRITVVAELGDVVAVGTHD